MDLARTIRDEFDMALRVASTRALSFTNADGYISALLEHIVKGNFTTWSSERDVLEYYEALSRLSDVYLAFVLDFLFELNTLFKAGMLLNSPEFDIESFLAKVYSTNRFGDLANISTVNKVSMSMYNVYGNLASEETYLTWIRKYPWLRAVLSIRIFAMERVLHTGSNVKPSTNISLKS